MKYRTQYTHPRAREISSNWVLFSGCPFSADFSLYWTSWAAWFSWFNTLFSIKISIQSQNFLQTRWVIARSPKPSPGSSCQSLSPLGGAPDLAVHWRRRWNLLPLLATWAAAAGLLLPGSGMAAQAVLPKHWPPSASSKSYWQPVTLEKTPFTVEISGIIQKSVNTV